MDTVPEGDPSQSPRLTAAATTPAGLSAPEHEIGLFTIASQTRERVGFTTNREALAAEVDGLFAEFDPDGSGQLHVRPPVPHHDRT
mgnify:CR=1 FL=1